MRDLSLQTLRDLQLESLSRVVPKTLLEKIDNLMTSFGHPWCLIGGIAVVAHGYNRTTDDVDIMVSCSREEFSRLRLSANGAGFKASTSHTGTIQRMVSNGAEVEVLLATTPLQVRACHDAVIVSLLSNSFPVISLRDIIVQKVTVADANPSRANKDWGDVNGILGTLPHKEIDKIVAEIIPDIPSKAARTLERYAEIVKDR